MTSSHVKTAIGFAALVAAGVAASPGGAEPPLFPTARETLEKLRSGAITATALVDAALAAAAQRGDLNAFVTLDAVGARAAAARADAARKNGTAGALEGLPIVVKDNIHVAGLPSSAGTPALAEFRPEADAPVVAALRKAGAIVLGKTNMHELAFGISGYNSAFHGATVGVRNPYDASRMAGGSSSGTGAAIGAGVVSAGLGTDTGGSARIPGAVNGVAGFRPTVGRYSAEGVAPISHTRDTVGVLARTVADIALIDGVITGANSAAAIPEKIRLGVCRPCNYAHLDADTSAVAEAALARLKAAGVELVEVDMPGLAELNGQVSFPVALYEAYDDLAAYLAKYKTGQTVESVAAKIASADVKGTYDGLVIPRKLPGPNGLVDAKPIYEAAIRDARPKLRKLYADTFAKYGIAALVFPTTPHLPMAQGPDASSLANFGLYIENTDPGSNAGIPGLSIPAGLTASGLPVGMEIDGPEGSDRALLGIGMALEAVWGRTPAPK